MLGCGHSGSYGNSEIVIIVHCFLNEIDITFSNYFSFCIIKCDRGPKCSKIFVYIIEVKFYVMNGSDKTKLKFVWGARRPAMGKTTIIIINF